MPNVLLLNQYEIGPVDGDGLVFGTESTGYQTGPRPIHASGDVASNDLPRPREDGLIFGRDYLGGKTVSFEINVLTDVNSPLAPGSAAAAHTMNADYLDQLERTWKNPRWRATPRSVAMLRACEVPGRTVRAYGRPRRYDEAVGALTRSGYSVVVCDFQMVDNRWYSDTESTVDVSLAIPPDGGLIAPIVAPIVTVPESSGDLAVTIGGTMSTWLVIEFIGPILNPGVRIGSTKFGLTGQLEAGTRVTIDPRPWVRTVTTPSGANFAGMLSRATPPMANMLLDPGTYSVQFTGTDVTGTGRVRLRWRDARARP